MIIGQILFTTLSNRFLGDIGKKPTRDLQTTDGQPSVGDTPLTKKEKTTYCSYRHFNMLRCLLLGWLRTSW